MQTQVELEVVASASVNTFSTGKSSGLSVAMMANSLGEKHDA